MSQSPTNDHPDKSGSSDEDDDDEVVEWIGEGAEFEARNHDHEEIDEDEEDVRNFGGRGLFHDGWEGDFHDEEDEFGFRPDRLGLLVEGHDINVRRLSEYPSDVTRAPMTKLLLKIKSGQRMIPSKN